MEFAELKVETWKLEQEQKDAWDKVGGFEYSRRDPFNGRPIEKDGCEYVMAQIIEETDSAIHVEIDDIWKCWLPKSTVKSVRYE